MRIRISRRRTLRWTGGVLAVLAVLFGLYFLGDYLTPRDAEGRPLILSPSVRAAEMYRRAALRWVEEMEEIDAGLETLLSRGEVTDPGQLYDLSHAVQVLVEQAADVTRDTIYTSAPPALIGLREQVQATAEAYFIATQDAALWVGAPQEENLRAALETLQQARELRKELEASRWLDGGE
jgi:hypothetical protein